MIDIIRSENFATRGIDLQDHGFHRVVLLREFQLVADILDHAVGPSFYAIASDDAFDGDDGDLAAGMVIFDDGFFQDRTCLARGHEGLRHDALEQVLRVPNEADAEKNSQDEDRDFPAAADAAGRYDTLGAVRRR